MFYYPPLFLLHRHYFHYAAIIFIEMQAPMNMLVASWILGFDVPIGMVVVLGSASHLARCWMAAYASDVVRAIGRIQVVYGQDVKVVHL
jgi:hypothetical protein